MINWYFSRGVKTYLSLGKYLLYGVLIYGYVNAIFSGEELREIDLILFIFGGVILASSFGLILYHEYLEYKANQPKANPYL